MANYPTIHVRRLGAGDLQVATGIAEAAGTHGVYVRNVLALHPRLGSKAVILGFDSDEGILGLAHFGTRGNLLVLQQPGRELDPLAAAAAILEAGYTWRIALAPPPVVAALITLGRLRTLVDRRQIYCRVTAAELVDAPCDMGGAVRPAEKRDLDPLMHAALRLNQSDLQVDPWCVDRSWLRRTTRQRIRDRTTWVIGPVGEPMCKLDLGSTGPAGVVIEGVYTRPELRGHGLASKLVATVARAQLAQYPLVCLHVAESNTAARRSYARCGMVEVESCQLMLRA